MIDARLECTYCGHRWDAKLGSDSGDLKCWRCGDRNIVAKRREAVVIDTYVGCPPFETAAELEARLRAAGLIKDHVVTEEIELDNPYQYLYQGWTD